MKRKHHAELHKYRDGFWGVRITLADGTRIEARDEIGTKQRIVYDKVQRVPDHLKSKIVPDLMRTARIKNLTGQ